jgi:RNA polymerase sigma-70 factor (ECF subfamily)
MNELADRLYFKLLVVRCQVGDRAAFEELVTRCQPRLRGFLYKMLSRQDKIDDLAQEIWMDVFRDLRRLKNPDAFLSWFYRIAHNRVFSLLRKREPPASIENVEIVEETTEEFTAEDAQAVHAALDQLLSEHREVLLLRFMEEMSYDDIAQVIACPLGTVRSRIHNAKRQLKTILERQTSHDSK